MSPLTLRAWRDQGARAPAARRRRPPRGRMRAAIAVVLVGFAAGGGGLWYAGYPAAAVRWGRTLAARAVSSVGLTVKDIYVSGRIEASAAEIEVALGIPRGVSILGVDLEAARARLETLGWIESATVSRRLPGMVHVRLIERRPFALWQHDGGLMLVSRDGAAITSKRLGRFAHLPLVVGPDAAEHAAALVEMLSGEPDLALRVSAAVRVGERRWNLKLDDSIEVKLPEEAAGEAWRRLAEYEREHMILGRDLVAIDLRIPDRLIVELTPAALARRAPGEDT